MKHLKKCSGCDELVPGRQKKCPFCNGWVDFTYPPKNSERNADIVKSLDSGNYTLQKLGTKYGISRERVRQIYFKTTGKKYANNFFVKKRIYKKEQEEIRLKTVKFLCSACGTPCTFKDASGRYSLCLSCHKIYYTRDPHTTFKCLNCGGSFHPLRNWKCLSEYRGCFHNRSCYFDFLSSIISTKLVNPRRFIQA